MSSNNDLSMNVITVNDLSGSDISGNNNSNNDELTLQSSESDVDVGSIISNSSSTQTQSADNYILRINEENTIDPEHSK